MAKPILEVNNLKKVYDDKPVVDGISFSVDKGEIFGILGPNGAGKTTTLEMIETLREIDGGTATIDGVDVAEHPYKIRGMIGVQPQTPGFQDKTKLTELIQMFAAAYGERVNPKKFLDEVNLGSKADSYVENLSDDDLNVLGYGRFRHALEAGIAAHHAGLVPPFREAVEALFLRSLVRVVFATETLALGINMPARSVIVESLSKFTGTGHEDLTPGNYTQLTGRAGRRGIDEVGFAAVVYSPFHRFNEVASLAGARSRPLRSAFRPTYNMVANLVRRYDRDDSYRLVRSSFAQFLSEEPLTRQLDAVIEVLERKSYMQGWALTPDGERLVAIYHDCDLLIAEAMRTGLFDDLGVADLTALVSLFTYESRRESVALEMPNSILAERLGALEALGARLRGEERSLRLPETRSLDTGFAGISAAWASGEELSEILMPPRRGRRDRGEVEPLMTGGDFVRNVKQLVDLLRQISLSPGPANFKAVAAAAAEQLIRGIVAASSGVGFADVDEVAGDPRKSADQPLT